MPLGHACGRQLWPLEAVRYNGLDTRYGGYALGTIQALMAEYGYLAIWFILLLDSLGIPLPTEASLLFAGAMIRTKAMFAPMVLATALAGALCGSLGSYWLGRRGGERLLHRLIRFFRIPAHRADQMQTWFERHGNRAILFARFIPFVRCLIGFPAGMMGMPLRNYIIYTLIGYAGWITLSLALGFGGMALFVHFELPVKQIVIILLAAAAVVLLVRTVLSRRRRRA